MDGIKWNRMVHSGLLYAIITIPICIGYTIEYLNTVERIIKYIVSATASSIRYSVATIIVIIIMYYSRDIRKRMKNVQQRMKKRKFQPRKTRYI